MYAQNEPALQYWIVLEILVGENSGFLVDFVVVLLTLSCSCVQQSVH